MTSTRYILGIHDGHNCGATLSADGAIVASVSEERLTRTKNEVGYPRKTIEEVLRLGGVDSTTLSEVAYASNFMHSPDHLRDLEPWYVVGIEKQRAVLSEPGDYRKTIFEARRRERVDTVCSHLGLPESHVVFVEHHLAHLAAAYYTAPNVTVDGPVLGLTCDGAGDGLAATVSVCRGNRIERIAETDRHASLGKIYSRVTLMMGMQPWEHEYKLMGLAPYASPERCEQAANSLRRLLRVSDDGLRFEQVGELSTNYAYEYLCREFERVRFDVVAGATQRFTEEMLLTWVRGCVASTGIANLVCAGGVFMNVKANMLLAALPEVASIYVMPSASDESLSIGACLYRHHAVADPGAAIARRWPDLYLGPDHDGAEEREALNAVKDMPGFVWEEPQDIEDRIAELLAAGDVVARCRGRMEWGARALGNRSILASAQDWRTVDRINRMIKLRDFWMPFAPSIRAESAARYFDDPKKLDPRFMTFAYQARAEGYADLVAGSHPADRTVRPQLVDVPTNSDFHRLLTCFEDRTGRGTVLNTSFNLHGFPIVNTPAEAVDVFLRSDLDHLALNTLVISRVRDERAG